METFARIFQVCFWSIMLVLYGILFIVCLPFEVIRETEEDKRY